MAYTPIQSLVDKLDGFEIVRARIAEILALETASQQALAPPQDPALWALDVKEEATNPFGKWLHAGSVKAGVVDKTPIVNVWYQNGSFNKRDGDPVERQKHDGGFNIDCYGYAVSSAAGPQDREAALEAQRAVRLVRNFLMAGTNVDLQLDPNFVWDRWVSNITEYQPEYEGRPAFGIVAIRVRLDVGFNEYSPQYEGEPLELVHVETKRAEDGSILVTQEFDYS